MNQTTRNLRVVAAAVAVMVFCAGQLQAQLWRKLIPGMAGSESSRDEHADRTSTGQTQHASADADLNANHGLTQESGPWLIVAASFSGEGASEQAQNLANELRTRHRLRTYLHQMSFKLGNEAPGRGLDAYGAPVRRRYQRDEVREYAVLIGDFPAIDDPSAQKTLERIKALEPQALNVDPGATAQTMAQMRQMQDAIMEKLGKPRERGPMAQAFFTRNPLLPPEFFVPKGVDPFVAKMNEGVEHSLLDCPGRFTVQVATFRGKTILQTSAVDDTPHTSFWNRRKQVDDRNPLVEAAENAHLLAEELRSHGFEAYEFHDRTESIVTIGSFAQAAQPLPDGRAVPAPAVQRIIETFGAAYDTPCDPLSGLGNDTSTKQRVAAEMQRFNLRVDGMSPAVPGLNPKHVKILRGSGKRKRTERIIPMDVYPHVIEVPKRSISSAYAG